MNEDTNSATWNGKPIIDWAAASREDLERIREKERFIKDELYKRRMYEEMMMRGQPSSYSDTHVRKLEARIKDLEAENAALRAILD